MHQVAPLFPLQWTYRKPNIVFRHFTEVFIEPTEINYLLFNPSAWGAFKPQFIL